MTVLLTAGRRLHVRPGGPADDILQKEPTWRSGVSYQQSNKYFKCNYRHGWPAYNSIYTYACTSKYQDLRSAQNSGPHSLYGRIQSLHFGYFGGPGRYGILPSDAKQSTTNALPSRRLQGHAELHKWATGLLLRTLNCHTRYIYSKNIGICIYSKNMVSGL